MTGTLKPAILLTPMKSPSLKALPLRVHTPASWACTALQRPLELLNDHAHLERKAATNALDLLPRWPEGSPPGRWIKTLSAIAKDETAHLAKVARILEKRGSSMTKAHSSSYARDLRRVVRAGEGKDELVDRLLVSALIELRSCERFALLAVAAEDDAELKRLYSSLWASEHGHFAVFLELGFLIDAEGKVSRRWEQLLTRESEIIQQQSTPHSIHGWTVA